MYSEKISLDLEEEKELGMKFGCWEYYQNEPWR
jgi:hypothetical protein